MTIMTTGTFLLIGDAMEPAVMTLTKTRHDALNSGLAVAAKYGQPGARERVYQSIFGVPALYAIPCWSVEAMTAIATQYAGPHADRVKPMAARIALGQPFGADEQGPPKGTGKGPRGGQKAKLIPEPPRRPPGGAAADLFAKAGAAR